MKILVTGSTGFIGRRLVSHLREQYPKSSIAGLCRKNCDLNDAKQTKEAIIAFNPDRIFHLAGLSRVRDDWGLDRYFTGNFLPTVNVLRGLDSVTKDFQLFFSSTVQVYGDSEQMVSEKDLPHPRHYYGFSKYLSEEALRDFSLKHGNARVVIGRLYNCIGPGQPLGFAVSDWCKKLRELADGAPLKVGTLNGIRSFVDVRDTVQTLPALLEVSTEPFSVYNIGAEVPLKMEEVLNQLVGISGKSVQIETVDSETTNQVAGLKVSTAKLKATLPSLSFRPLSDTLRDMYDTVS